MRTNVTLEEALALLLDECPQTQSIHVPILDSLGGVLAEDIVSDINIPPFDRSPLDGYALRSVDSQGASPDQPIELDVIDYVPAGSVSEKCVKDYQAVRIMTGAKIPLGADVVIRQEEVENVGEKILIKAPMSTMENISRVGEDIHVNQMVIKAGTVIEPAEIGLMATLGKSYVSVYMKPRVAILSTGDELLEIQQPLQDGKIRNSNSYTIAAQVKKTGGKALMLGVCGDDIESISEKLRAGLGIADIVITTGGVSVGDKDLVKESFMNAGAEMLFWKVRMKPGTPIAVARLGKKLLIGLSGNPAAAFITFEQFVRPLVLKMMGREKHRLMNVETILENDFSKVSNQNRFVRGTTVYRDGSFYTKFPGKHSSGVLSSLSGNNSLFYVPAGTGPYEKGQKVSIQLLDQPEVKS
ncbi:molybdopterin molybdotransferase MoeA [Tindallia californiensis]|uniref:Molybdopterin molybdenumtransferase n=1 Tax=Tindallia californiensis TaxID=159292 RepID=A0A1H3QUN4_9FIRM|nr:gephyrin-like molybdotransferase Glp [Tindallia californiensis]SDZ16429.1 molybdopterin molybdotransferase [Tindallia californiensis]